MEDAQASGIRKALGRNLHTWETNQLVWGSSRVCRCPHNPEVDCVSPGPWNRSHLTLLNTGEGITKHLSERLSSFEASGEERETVIVPLSVPWGYRFHTEREKSSV